MADENENDEPRRLIIDTPLTKEEQVSLTDRLQTLTLKTFENRLESQTISDTGLATLVRFLMANGWSVDPSRLPKGLESLLTSKVDPKELDEDVIPLRRNA